MVRECAYDMDRAHKMMVVTSVLGYVRPFVSNSVSA
jgi:hypothetical protein